MADGVPGRDSDPAGHGRGRRRRHVRRMASSRCVRHHVDLRVDVPVLRARFLARHGAAVVVRRAVAAVPDRWIRGRRQLVIGALGAPRPGSPHGPAGRHADACVHRRVHDRDALVDPRHGQRGVHPAGPRQGLRDSAVRRRHAVPNALLPVVSLSALNFGFVLSGAIAVEAIYSWPGIGQATLEAIRGPDFPMLQGLFLLSSGGDHPQPGRRPDPRLARSADRWEMNVIAFPGHAGRAGCWRRGACSLASPIASVLARTGPMSREVAATATALSPRSLVRARRVAAVRGFGSAFRRDSLAMIGLVVLAGFTVMALLAPVISPQSGLSAVDSIINPVWASPSRAFPMGTDNLGRSVAAQFVWGSRVSLFVGVTATLLTIVIGALVGIAAGFFGGRVDCARRPRAVSCPRQPAHRASSGSRSRQMPILRPHLVGFVAGSASPYEAISNSRPASGRARSQPSSSSPCT